MILAVTGAAAGLLFGYALRRGNLCFHSAVRAVLDRGSRERRDLLRAWALAVALTAVGLTAIYELGPWDGLNQGLALRPVHNVAGGLIFGVGMVIAASCASGLFYKLGSGMLGAAAGLGGWAVGELSAGAVRIPGPTVVGHGAGATIPGLLGVPRWAAALGLSAVVAVVVVRALRRGGASRTWVLSGSVLGAAAIVAWILAGLGGHSFGPSTVGAVDSIRRGAPAIWLIAFLSGIVAGSAATAAGSGALWIRGESGLRYGQLVVGGFLLGLGARIAGGCNLGHGLSGLAQLNVSSVVTVSAAFVGVALAAAVRVRLIDPLPDWRARQRT